MDGELLGLMVIGALPPLIAGCFLRRSWAWLIALAWLAFSVVYIARGTGPHGFWPLVAFPFWLGWLLGTGLMVWTLKTRSKKEA